MFSNFEAIKYGIQLLMIPFMGDQYRNARRVENTGYGKFLDFKDLSNDSLLDNLNEMLTTDKYSFKAKEISAIFNANPVHPMDEFVWWAEYVIKFRGARHLKTVAAEMPLFTYLLLDVILVNFLVVSCVLFLIHYLITWIFGRKKLATIKAKKQQ